MKKVLALAAFSSFVFLASGLSTSSVAQNLPNLPSNFCASCPSEYSARVVRSRRVVRGGRVSGGRVVSRSRVVRGGGVARGGRAVVRTRRVVR